MDYFVTNINLSRPLLASGALFSSLLFGAIALFLKQKATQRESGTVSSVHVLFIFFPILFLLSEKPELFVAVDCLWMLLGLFLARQSKLKWEHVFNVCLQCGCYLFLVQLLSQEAAAGDKTIIFSLTYSILMFLKTAFISSITDPNLMTERLLRSHGPVSAAFFVYFFGQRFEAGFSPQLSFGLFMSAVLLGIFNQFDRRTSECDGAAVGPPILVAAAFPGNELAALGGILWAVSGWTSLILDRLADKVYLAKVFSRLNLAGLPGGLGFSAALLLMTGVSESLGTLRILLGVYFMLRLLRGLQSLLEMKKASAKKVAWSDACALLPVGALLFLCGLGVFR